ncbi:MAG: DUF58 domain-containing protein [Phycisphaeraceae bacterium]|nr:DUF58 domain-containing protein [Phycisphaeraceae bacterium]MBX3367270.1 DUF58 domain-containing protein [Phycisphaeraceae bacterium]QYK49380.1 MAG: DUF58 domain-containing protein [Phycisphaeraceae bacterium]
MRLASNDDAAAIVRRRYHASAGSLLYVLTTVFLAIGAINSQNNLLFFAFGIAAGAMVVSGFVSGPALMGVRARRDIPAHGEVGREIRIRYTVRNRSRFWPAFGLSIAERSDGASPDRSLGTVASCVQHVGAREEVRATIAVVPRHRGLVTLERFSISTTFPLGLTRKSVELSQRATLIIRPRTLRLRSGILDRLDGGQARLSSARNIAGHGEEIFGIRAYAPGDSMRSIAWRASARAGSLVVRQNALPAPARIWIDLRPSLSGLSPHEQEIAVSIAASISKLADSKGYAVGVVGFGSLVLPKPGKRHIETVLDLLARLRISADSHAVAPSIRPRDAVVVIAADREPVPSGSLLLSVSEASSILAPEESLPEPPPIPPSRLRRALAGFLGLSDSGGRAAT